MCIRDRLVTVRDFSLLERPLSDIVAVTMPCFGTTERTRTNAPVSYTHLDVYKRQKDTSSRPAKDLGGTLRRTLRTTLRSYDSRASGDLFCPRRQGCVANMTSNPNRITVAAPGFLSEDFFQTGAAV